MSRREGAAKMCAGYTFLKRKKKWPKYVKIYRRGARSAMEFRQETAFFGS
jgi:hypothetical protein